MRVVRWRTYVRRSTPTGRDSQPTAGLSRMLTPRGGTCSPARLGSAHRVGCLDAVGVREEHQRRFDPLADVLRIGEAQLEEDRVDVLLDGALRQEQRLGDRRVALALGDLREHFPLAGRQLVQGRALRTAASGHERLDDLRVDQRSALGDRADGGHELGSVVHALLEQIGATVRATLEQRERVERIGELAEHDDADRRVGVAELGGEPDPLVGARRRHADVGEHHIGPLVLAGLAQRLEVAHRGDDLDRWVDSQQLVHAFAHDQAVLAEGYPDRHGRTIAAAADGLGRAGTTETYSRSAGPGSSVADPRPARNSSYAGTASPSDERKRSSSSVSSDVWMTCPPYGRRRSSSLSGASLRPRAISAAAPGSSLPPSCLRKSLSTPMSVILPPRAPLAAPTAMPTSGARNSRPISPPHIAPPAAPVAVVLTAWLSLILPSA